MRGAARRTLSFALGVALTLIALEGVMVVSQWVFVRFQDTQNRAALEGGEYRVLAIGESTTAVAGDETNEVLIPRTSYPAQLEAILNQRQSAITFRVLNNGMMGGTTPATMSRLEASVVEFEPDMIIAMMGIKDTPDQSLPDAPVVSWWRRTRVAQLGGWLVESALLRRDEVETEVAAGDAITEELSIPRSQLRKYIRETRMVRGAPSIEALPDLEIATYLWFIQRHERAAETLRAIIREHDVGYYLLGRVLFTGDRRQEAMALMREAIEGHPAEGMYRIALAEMLIEDDQLDAAEQAIADAREASAGWRSSDYVLGFLGLVEARLARERGEHQRSLEVLRAIDRPEGAGAHRKYFPPKRMLIHAGMGQTYYALGAWGDAEHHLRRALEVNPGNHANMWLLGEVYRRTGRFEEEEAMRRELLGYKGRLGEYYELAKLFDLAGQPERKSALIDAAIEAIPTLQESYRRLYALSERYGVRVVVMQYPSFELSLAHKYAPPTDGVHFIDNEHLFDADPDACFYEPGFPHSFSHYTQEGARVMAEHVADEVLGLLDAG